MGLFSSKKNKDDIPDSWLSDDELWFAAVHGLPVTADSYSKEERMMLSIKTQEYMLKEQEKINKKKQQILYN